MKLKYLNFKILLAVMLLGALAVFAVVLPNSQSASAEAVSVGYWQETESGSAYWNNSFESELVADYVDFSLYDGNSPAEIRENFTDVNYEFPATMQGEILNSRGYIYKNVGQSIVRTQVVGLTLRVKIDNDWYIQDCYDLDGYFHSIGEIVYLINLSKMFSFVLGQEHEIYTYYTDKITNMGVTTTYLRISNIVKFTPTFLIDNQVELIPLPTAPVKNGYTFVGWYFDEALTQAYDGSPINSDTALYAKYELTTYNITYNVNGGNLDGSQVTSYTIESGDINLSAPTRYGYVFKGWYANENLSGSAITTIASGATGNVTVYAKWEVAKYTVTFYVDNAVYKELIVEHGTIFDLLYIVDIATFEPVSLYADSQMLQSFATAVTDDIVLFAESEFTIYASLTYTIDGETITDLLEYGSLFTNLRNISLPGYDFGGWYYDEDYTQSVKTTDKLTTNTVIYAKITTSAVDDGNDVGALAERLAAHFKVWWWAYAIGVGLVLTLSLVYAKKRRR